MCMEYYSAIEKKEWTIDIAHDNNLDDFQKHYVLVKGAKF